MSDESSTPGAAPPEVNRWNDASGIVFMGAIKRTEVKDLPDDDAPIEEAKGQAKPK